MKYLLSLSLSQNRCFLKKDHCDITKMHADKNVHPIKCLELKEACMIKVA